MSLRKEDPSAAITAMRTEKDPTEEEAVVTATTARIPKKATRDPVEEATEGASATKTEKDPKTAKSPEENAAAGSAAKEENEEEAIAETLAVSRVREAAITPNIAERTSGAKGGSPEEDLVAIEETIEIKNNGSHCLG